jgi:hypothetical protein
MRKKLNESLGLVTPADNIKITTMLSNLIEFNTVQVINMLFAKPRNIWYSPDLRVRFEIGKTKWIFFQLDKLEIISGRAFKEFRKELMKPADDNESLLSRILDNTPDALSKSKDLTMNMNILESDGRAPPFCIFIISTEPVPPRMVDKDDIKDATDTMFDNSSFGIGGISTTDTGGLIREDGTTFTSALLAKAKRIFPLKKPTQENCESDLGQISKATSELSNMFNESLKEVGMGVKYRVDGFLDDAVKKAAAEKEATAAAEKEATAAAEKSASVIVNIHKNISMKW